MHAFWVKGKHTMNYKPWLALATATSHLIQRGCNTSDGYGVTAKRVNRTPRLRAVRAMVATEEIKSSPRPCNMQRNNRRG